MKKTVIILILLASIVVGVYIRHSSSKTSTSFLTPPAEKYPPQEKLQKKNPSPAKKESKSIFIPYWSLGDSPLELQGYDRLIYFGIAPDKAGINSEEPGYAGIGRFINMVSQSNANSEIYLTLRMIDEDINTYVLENDPVQKKIIEETRQLLKENSFDGVVLDLETSNILDTAITGKISTFVQQLYSEVSKDYRKVLLALYGDNFFRKRPYDVEFLAKNSDEIMVMAYDFHKSRGEPGPNFPYDLGRQYDYSFKQMLEDFSSFVPKEKLTIIYGMFGYDWSVDEKKRPINPAKALTLNEIRQKFLGKCDWQNCVVKKDEVSGETQVSYIISTDLPDEQGIYRIDYHIIWFEDEESAQVKRQTAQEKGIGSSAYWAYSYF